VQWRPCSGSRRPPDAAAALSSAPEPGRQEDDVRKRERDGEPKQAPAVCRQRRLERRFGDRRGVLGARSRRKCLPSTLKIHRINSRRMWYRFSHLILQSCTGGLEPGDRPCPRLWSGLRAACALGDRRPLGRSTNGRSITRKGLISRRYQWVRGRFRTPDGRRSRSCGPRRDQAGGEGDERTREDARPTRLAVPRRGVAVKIEQGVNGGRRDNR
jgi:hypothetical protein